MQSLIYQYMDNMVVNLPVKRGPGLFMNASVPEQCALNNKIFGVAKFTILTPLSLLS
jgi:hypothetical protein